MAFCTECGKQLAEGAKFCYECGAKVNPEHKSNNRERKTVYDGEIHKCPVCGDMIAAYDAVCKSCGYEIRARKTTSVVHELSLKLEKTEDAKKKEELIRTFYIPNTREDIHEFFILALSQVKIGGMNTDAWMVKLEQAYQKAELSFPGTQEFERLKQMYEKARQMNRKNSAVGLMKGTSEFFGKGVFPKILSNPIFSFVFILVCISAIGVVIKGDLVPLHIILYGGLLLVAYIVTNIKRFVSWVANRAKPDKTKRALSGDDLFLTIFCIGFFIVMIVTVLTLPKM